MQIQQQFIHTDCDGEDKEEREEGIGRKEAEGWERRKGGSADHADCSLFFF
jgi:hypothetical protein